jgi:hypothetical protein
MVHSCNPSTQEVEAGRLRVQCQPELHREKLSQKTQEEERGRGGGKKSAKRISYPAENQQECKSKNTLKPW